jgi:hypothetical protein
MRLFKFLSLAVVLMFSVSIARADSGGDGHPKLGGSGPGSPNCNSFQGTTSGTGTINSDCTVNTTPATTIVFAMPDSLTSSNPDELGLTCSASQLTSIGWTQNANTQVTINGVLVDECSFTAPTASQVTLQDIANALILSVVDPTGTDCQCNWDDFITGIPVGCDITVTTNGDPANQLFAGNAAYDVAPSPSLLVPFPEPGSLILLAIGLAGLALFQYRRSKSATA